MKAVAYIRVSTQEQKLGPQAQLHAIQAWCSTHGIELVDHPFCDLGVSGSKELKDRPALLAAVNAVQIHGAPVFVAHKRDRIARDVSVVGHLDMILRRFQCRIYTADKPFVAELGDDPYVRMMEGFQDLFAEFERGMIRARVRASMNVKRRRGESLGGIPYGFRLAPDGVRLVRDVHEQRAVRMIKKLRLEGASLREIASRLNEAKIKPRGAKAWYPTTISRIAKSNDGEDGDS